MDRVIARLLAHGRIQAARKQLERGDAETLAHQVELSAIPAPTGEETARGARVAELLAEAGLSDVSVDAVGNVCAWAPGRGARSADEGDDCVVVCAHLDTVFGPSVDVTVRRTTRPPASRLEGPGISDNARGLTALIGIAAALNQAAVPLRRPVLFAATVGEEGSGDLRGIRHLLRPPPDGVRPCAAIALDGAGVERVVHRALGSRRYRVTYRGPGGHSWAAFGVANAANAVGRAAAGLADLVVPDEPRTSCTVARIGGGNGLNSIPQEAWLELDLRSEDQRELLQLDRAVEAILIDAAEQENRRRTPGTAPIHMDRQLLGDRPCGATPWTHPLVQTAVAATKAIGKTHQLAIASTDANIPIALGIPAIALGAGGKAGDTHLSSEWYENEEGALGLVRALLVVAATAGVADET